MRYLVALAALVAAGLGIYIVLFSDPEERCRKHGLAFVPDQGKGTCQPRLMAAYLACTRNDLRDFKVSGSTGNATLKKGGLSFTARISGKQVEVRSVGASDATVMAKLENCAKLAVRSTESEQSSKPVISPTPEPSPESVSLLRHCVGRSTSRQCVEEANRLCVRGDDVSRAGLVYETERGIEHYCVPLETKILPKAVDYHEGCKSDRRRLWAGQHSAACLTSGRLACEAQNLRGSAGLLMGIDQGDLVVGCTDPGTTKTHDPVRYDEVLSRVHPPCRSSEQQTSGHCFLAAKKLCSAKHGHRYIGFPYGFMPKWAGIACFRYSDSKVYPVK